MIPANDKSEGAQTLRARLEALLEIFDMFDSAFKQVFSAEQSLHDLRTLMKKNLIARPLDSINPPNRPFQPHSPSTQRRNRTQCTQLSRPHQNPPPYLPEKEPPPLPLESTAEAPQCWRRWATKKVKVSVQKDKEC